MTLAEHNAILAADPAYRKMRQEKDDQLKQKAAILKNDASPLLNDLRSAGWPVESLWDLVNTSEDYAEAIPILINHLDFPYLDRNREAIARALAVPAAAYAWPILKDKYQSAHQGSGFKEGLACALSETASESVRDDLISLIMDPSHGESRLFLLSGLRKLRSSAARSAVIRLAQDPAFAAEIKTWKRKGT